ncbi:hypothetical protein FBU30_010796 [Linnemannia zychae]|nr:hypothetical protein FBU30_010796 [Linnemannia zychae]
MQTISSGSAHHVSTCTHVNPTLISSSLTPQYTINPIPASYSTGFNLEHTTSIYRRGSMTMNTHDEYSSASATMNRSLNMAGATYVSNHQNCSEWNSTAEQIENCAITDNEQHRDNFDSSINLSAPFQLLLVNQRFADAAVHSLYRNLVFHGHDLFQMESIFSMLCENDRTLDESFLVSTKANDEDQAQICNNRTHVLGLQDKLKSNSIRIQGGCNGDIFDNLEGKPQRKTIESNVLNVDVKTNVDSSASSSSSFMEKGCRNDKFMQHSNSSKEQCSANDRNGETIASQNGVPHTYSNGPKWRYWRYTRRVVLNFTHPQASPEMLIRAIECIKSRCYNQIQVLDLHANEKMQDSGLETPVELIRLFGSGFSKLQYLRLQGGFVDNHLLYALLRNFSPPQHPQLVDSAQGNPNNRWAQSSLLTVEPCCLSQVFLGPGSVTDSAIEKLIDIAGMTLEVFVVTSCVDFGGGALASLLTECPKLRVLGVHKSLARDKELLEGLGMPKENTDPVFQQYQHPYPHHQSYSEQQQQQQQAIELSDKGESLPQITRKLIIAPLERLELGTTKLTNIGIAEILKATCKTLRFLVLETQHFRDELLRSVISPFCTELEGLYFDDPEQVQRHQQQMQGFGFSAGRRGAHLSRHRILFGRSGRSFYMDPNQHDRSQSRSQSSRNIDNLSTADYQGRSQHKRTAKVSAWLGEITTDEWVEFGDCALWSSAASPAVSYDNGGTGESNEGRSSYHSRHFGQPLYQMFHKPAITTGNISVHGFSHQSRYQSVPNWLLGDSDDLLNRYQISRELVDEVQNALPNLKAFTVIDIDFILERKGLYESQLLMQQDDMWVQSTGFRALQIFYLCLFLTSICFTIFR